MRATYRRNKDAKVDDICYCPSCDQQFKKQHYQQAFCKTKGGTKCKDKYWNTVTETKRNNTTRISPANQRFRDRHIENQDMEDDHPFSSEALGQWI